MKRRLLLIALLFASLANPAVTLTTDIDGNWETVPKLIPSSAEDVKVGDCRVLVIHLINVTGGAVTVTIKDKQAVPLDIIPPAISIPANSDQVWTFPARYAPGGVNWVASAGSSIVGYVRGR